MGSAGGLGFARSGFSLIELLVVVAILAILAVGLVPAFQSLRGAGLVGSDVVEISDLIESARYHAITKNTYVYFGAKQDADSRSGFTIVVAASRDGTRPLAFNDDSIVVVARPRKIQNLKLETVTDFSGNLNRSSDDRVVNFSTVDGFANLDLAIGTASQHFNKVIEFDPQGVARFQSPDSFANVVEIPLKPIVGDTRNPAVLQLNAMSGMVTIFRP
jgi:prepilin-type N-terminal cleavage/methylation domain-containing protein